MLFTENGVAMLSSVLYSDLALEINIAIMRIFTKIRSSQSLAPFVDEVGQLKKDTNKIFKIVLKD